MFKTYQHLPCEGIGGGGMSGMGEVLRSMQYWA